MDRDRYTEFMTLPAELLARYEARVAALVDNLSSHKSARAQALLKS